MFEYKLWIELKKFFFDNKKKLIDNNNTQLNKNSKFINNFDFNHDFYQIS
jgi:hypothetical protein